MKKRTIMIAALAATLWLLLPACKKTHDLPTWMGAAPPDSVMLIDLDVSSLAKRIHRAMNESGVSQGQKNLIEGFLRVSTGLTGVDTRGAKHIHFLTFKCYVEPDCARGVMLPGLFENALGKGHDPTRVESVAGFGLLSAPRTDWLQSMRASQSGQASSLAKVSRATALARLSKQDPKIDDLRIYLLTAGLPRLASLPVRLDAIGVFVDQQYGMALHVVSRGDDGKKVQKVMDQIWGTLQGEFIAKQRLGTRIELPFNLSQAEEAVMGKVITNSQVHREGDRVWLAYKGDMSEVVNHLVGLTVRELGAVAAEKKNPARKIPDFTPGPGALKNPTQALEIK